MTQPNNRQSSIPNDFDVTPEAPAVRTQSPSTARVPYVLRRLCQRLSACDAGTLTVRLDDGREGRVAGSQAGHEAEIHLHRPWRALLRLLTRGEIGFAEGYIAGDWSTPHLGRVLGWAIDNEQAVDQLAQRPLWQRTLDRLRHSLRRNSIAGSRANIRFHYDLGNDFYRTWLDPSMTYSSAWFTRGDESLEVAQTAKYERLLDALDAEPGAHILEIGCGWGGFAEVAARRGFRVTGITLSDAQLEYAQARIQQAGLADRVSLEKLDYRHLPRHAAAPFDHVVSIEMFEAVGERWWSTYFDVVRRALKPGGRVALQVITIEEEAFERYRCSADFIQLYVFPGGMLPPASRLLELGQQNGLKTLSQDFFGQDYARTLAEWHDRVEDADTSLRGLGYDDRFLRMWRYYLRYCEIGFLAKRIDVTHTIFERGA
ncbi:MAG: class I SAM-dependent methyltransferase [Thioalkalivibrionaceae bacterium]